MDRAQYLSKLEELAAGERELLQTNAIAHVVFLCEGRHEEAAWALKEAILARWRLQVINAETVVEGRFDGRHAGILSDVASGAGFDSWFDLLKKNLALRAFREFQAAWRMFAEEGVRLGPHLLEKFYALDPTEREKKVKGFAPLESDIKDVNRPCGHDLAPVICEDMFFGRPVPIKVICTECSQRFEAQGGGRGGGVIVRRYEQVETDAISSRITQVIRPLVRA